MLNHFINSLSATSNHRFATGHGFEVHTSQPLVGTWQHEYGAASHGLRYFGPALPADKLNLLSNAQFADQSHKLGTIRTFSDDAATQTRKRGLKICNSSQNKFVPLAGQQSTNNQNFRIDRFCVG